MKKIKVLLAFVFISTLFLVGFAQCKKEISNNANYLKLISESKQWYVTYHLDSCQYFDCTYTELYSIGNDTVINEVNYKNVYLSRGIESPMERILYGQVRETNDKKVYLFKGGVEKLYYDFGMQIFDKLSNWQLIKIDTINVYGQNRLKFELKSICSSSKACWIEGIGDTRGLFYNDCFDCIGDVVIEDVGGSVYELNCVEEMESTIYNSELYDDCWIYKPPK
jgi:hypothetical protein